LSVPKKDLKKKSKYVGCWHGEESERNRKNKVKFGGIKALLYYKIKYQIIIVIISLKWN